MELSSHLNWDMSITLKTRFRQVHIILAAMNVISCFPFNSNSDIHFRSSTASKDGISQESRIDTCSCSRKGTLIFSLWKKCLILLIIKGGLRPLLKIFSAATYPKTCIFSETAREHYRKLQTGILFDFTIDGSQGREWCVIYYTSLLFLALSSFNFLLI